MYRMKKQTLELAERTKRSAPSEIRKIFAQLPEIAKTRMQMGLLPLINLSIGEPHLPENPVVSAAAQTPPFPGGFGYSAAGGREETLEAIVRLYNMYYPKADFKKSEVMVTSGATGGLALAFAALINPGDKVIVFVPFFSLYESQVNNLEGEVIRINTSTTHFKPNLKALQEVLAAHPDAKAIVLNYPNNPTGVSVTQQEMQKLIEILEPYPSLSIILDEVYCDLSEEEPVMFLEQAPELKTRCIVVHSGSKGLVGAPGRRIGMVGAPEECITAMIQQQNMTLTSIPDETQKALIVAIEERIHPKTKWLHDVRKTYAENRRCVLEALQELEMAPVSKPEGGFFVMMQAGKLIGEKIPDTVLFKDRENRAVNVQQICKKIGSDYFRTDADIVQYFLHVAGVAMVPGSGFGIAAEEGQIRISCAKDMALLNEAMQRITQVVQAVLLQAYPKIQEREAENRFAFFAAQQVSREERMILSSRL